MFKHSLAVMRCQPFHCGHERVLDRMLEKSEMITVVLGSIGKKDEKNPWSFHDRKRMIKNIYGDKPEWKRMRIFGAYDIGDNMRWSQYILQDVVKEHYVNDLEIEDYPAVDSYFAGCDYDAQWFRDQKEIQIIIEDRTNQEVPYVSASMVREMGMLQDPRWMLYVNKANHELVRKHFNWIKWDRL